MPFRKRKLRTSNFWCCTLGLNSY